MRSLRLTTAALLAILVSGVLVLAAAPASAQASSPCPPGQPSGRPPGQPPSAPGQPDGRPPAYPPGSCNLQLGQGSASRGESVTVAGSGFVPGESVVLSVGSQRVASLVADPAGVITGSITVPEDAPLGRTAVQAAGDNQVLSAAFEVVAAPGASRSAAAQAGTSVAATGAYVAGLTLAALVLIGLGTMFVLAARRRRVQTA